MIKKIAALFLFMGFVVVARAQKLYPLHGNATIMQYNKRKAAQNNTPINGRNPRTTNDSLHIAGYLPFFDDFSYAGPYPDNTKWLDQYVFVNHTKAIAPPTLGVATFDGLNQYGFPYDSTVASAGGGFATPASSDTLTSFPIRLDSLLPLICHSCGLSPADSVYLSFYYQNMGFWVQTAADGYELDLDFYSPIDSTWTEVWSVPGCNSCYNPDSTWHLVMIPITDTSYFHKGFQFRFRNLSCACGDDDHWHIDEVYLSNQRFNTDTIQNDISFVYDLQSPLKNYTQMPYTQFTGISDMKDSIYATLRSNFYNSTAPTIRTVGISTYYKFFDATGNLLGGTNIPGSANITSYYNTGYCKDPALIHPSLNNFTYTTPLSNNEDFLMKFYVTPPVGSTSLTVLDQFPQNDTIYFHQEFSNYFSYDDGSAEADFGLESTNGPGNYQTASQFTLNKTDTLRAIDIFFDPVIDVSILESSPFNLIVLGDHAGMPGNPIYTDTTGGNLRYPYFAPDHPVTGVQRENMFIRYGLLHPIVLNAGAVFYIGINQILNYPAIPVGFDMNTDHHDNMFYNPNYPSTSPYYGWFVFPGDEDPSYRGSLMMRPVFGDSLLALGIQKYNNTVSANITVYPNPATDMVYIQSDNTITKVVVTDLLGSIVIEQSENPVQTINTASLQNGAYLIKAFTDKGLTDTKKLIISR